MAEPQVVTEFGTTRNTYTKGQIVRFAKLYALNGGRLSGTLMTAIDEPEWADYNTPIGVCYMLEFLEEIDLIARTGKARNWDNRKLNSLNGSPGIEVPVEHTTGAWVREGLNGFTKQKDE